MNECNVQTNKQNYKMNDNLNKKPENNFIDIFTINKDLPVVLLVCSNLDKYPHWSLTEKLVHHLLSLHLIQWLLLFYLCSLS